MTNQTNDSANVLNAYREYGLGSKPAKSWPAKYVGPAPTADMVLNYHRLGARHGKQCLAGAMALRADGVTGAEIVIACTAPQLNKMRGFIADALVRRVHVGKRNNGEVYKLELTPKGLKRIESAVKREAEMAAAGETAPEKADKPTGAAKAKKAAKAKPANKRTSKPRKGTGKGDVTTGATLTVDAPQDSASLLPDLGSPVDQQPRNGLQGDQPQPSTGDADGTVNADM